jgi:hypothetical protein
MAQAELAQVAPLAQTELALAAQAQAELAQALAAKAWAELE